MGFLPFEFVWGITENGVDINRKIQVFLSSKTQTVEQKRNFTSSVSVLMTSENSFAKFLH